MIASFPGRFRWREDGLDTTLMHVHHPHKNMGVRIRVHIHHIYEHPCFYGGGAHASTVVPRPSSLHQKRPGNEATS